MLGDFVKSTLMPAAPSGKEGRLAAGRCPRLSLVFCALVAGLPLAGSASACADFGEGGCLEARLHEPTDASDTASLLQSSLPHARKVAGDAPVHAALADLMQITHASGLPAAAQFMQKVRSIAQSAIASGAREDPGTIQIINNLTQLLEQSTMSAINTGLTEDQAEVNSLVGTIDACTVATLDDSTASARRSNLSSCLATQSALLAAKTNADTALSSFLTQLPAPDPLPAAASRTVANIRTYFQDLTSYVTAKSAELEALNGAAEAAAAELAAQKPVCAGKQGTFELAMCGLGATSVDICNAYTGCYNTAKTAYEGAQPALQESEAARKAQYKALQKTKCYLNILKSSDTAAAKEQQITACDALTVDTASLTVTYPSTPAAKTCTTVTKLPCTTDFTNDEYDQFADWNTELKAACTPCLP
jgi:hypothetical protein